MAVALEAPSSVHLQCMLKSKSEKKDKNDAVCGRLVAMMSFS